MCLLQRVFPFFLSEQSSVFLPSTCITICSAREHCVWGNFVFDLTIMIGPDMLWPRPRPLFGGFSTLQEWGFLSPALSLSLSFYGSFFFVYEMWERNTKQAVRYIPEFTFSFWPCLALPFFDCRSLPLAGWLVGWLVGCSAQQISDFRLDSVPFSSPFPQKPPRGWGIPVCRNGTHSLAGTTECNYIDDSGWILEWNFAHCRYIGYFFF